MRGDWEFQKTHPVHGSCHLSSLPSPADFFPKEALEVTIQLPGALRTVCLLIYTYMVSDCLWLSIASEEGLSQKSAQSLASNPISQNCVMCPFMIQSQTEEKCVPWN